jgi:hypothetical protein
MFHPSTVAYVYILVEHQIVAFYQTTNGKNLNQPSLDLIFWMVVLIKIQFSSFTSSIKKVWTMYVCGDNSPLTLLFCLDRWGMTRHFHYVSKIVAAFFWTVPALFKSGKHALYHILFRIVLVAIACGFCHISTWYLWHVSAWPGEEGSWYAHQSM